MIRILRKGKQERCYVVTHPPAVVARNGLVSQLWLVARLVVSRSSHNTQFQTHPCQGRDLPENRCVVKVCWAGGAEAPEVLTRIGRGLRDNTDAMYLCSFLLIALLPRTLCYFSEENHAEESEVQAPTLVIAIIARNTAHSLPYYLGALERLHYPKERISIWQDFQPHLILQLGLFCLV